MVRHHQHLRRQRGWLFAHQALLDQLADIAGQQQQAAPIGLQPQHAGTVVAQIREVLGRMQYPQLQAIQLPRHAGLARALTLLRLAAHHHHMLRRIGTLDRVHTATVVVVVVADDQQIQPIHAQRAQGRHHRRLAHVQPTGKGRAGVIQHGVTGCAHQHRQPLPDIQQRHHRLPRCRTWQRGEQQGREQQQRQRLARHAAWQQQPERTRQSQRERQQAGFGQIDQRTMQARDRIQQRPQGLHQPGRQLEQPAAGTGIHQLQQRPGQGHRHHPQAHPRHREQIAQRSGHRRLTEEPHCQRQQPQGHDALHRDQTAPPPDFDQCARQAPQQPGHAEERQPESGIEHRQRIDQQHHDPGQRKGLHRIETTPPQHRQQRRANHQQGAHRRQGEAGQRGVASRRQQRRESRRLRQWQAQAK